MDIGAIEFIHRKLVALRDAGCAVLLISAELEEVTALADRMLVIYQGNIFAGLWYPVGIALATAVIGMIFLPETKDRTIG